MKITLVVFLVAFVALVVSECKCDRSAPCCSQWGYCGSTADYCSKSKGCRFGCWSSSSSSSSSSGSTSGNSGSSTTSGSGSGTTTSGGGGSSGGIGPSGLTDCQQEIIFRVTSVFETGNQNLKFDFCAYENDGQGYDAGFMSATSRAGAILGIVKLYCKSVSNAGICSLISPLQKAVGSSTKNGLDQLCNQWRQASNDKKFHDAQWEYTVQNYFSPATKHAKEIGLTIPLGLGQLYDTSIQLGDGSDKNSLGGIINTVNNKVGKPPQAGQAKWLSAFMDERTQAEYRKGGAYPGTLYRIRSYQHVVKNGQAAMTDRTVTFLDNSGNPMKVTCSGNLH